MSHSFIKHQLRPMIDRVFSFEEAPAAYGYMESGAHMDKIVITLWTRAHHYLLLIPDFHGRAYPCFLGSLWTTRLRSRPRRSFPSPGHVGCASCLIIRRPSGGHSNIFMVEAADAFERNHPPLLRRLDRPAFRCVFI